MESLKRIGELCKQHYEKILLTLALVGLACAVGILYTAGQNEEGSGRVRVVAKKAVAVDLAANEEALKRLASPPALDFSAPHHLLNPVKWQEKADGSLLKIETGDEVGVAQLHVLKITPLHYTIELRRVASESSAYLTVTDEAAENPLLRARRTKFVNKDQNPRNEIFILKDWQGGKEDPVLTLELVANQATVTVTKDKPYQRVDAHTADLKYDIDGRTFTNLREGDEIRFGGENYKIVAINQDEVVLSAVLNKRKHTIRFSGG